MSDRKILWLHDRHPVCKRGGCVRGEHGSRAQGHSLGPGTDSGRQAGALRNWPAPLALRLLALRPAAVNTQALRPWGLQAGQLLLTKWEGREHGKADEDRSPATQLALDSTFSLTHLFKVSSPQ